MKRTWIVLIVLGLGLAAGIGLYLWYPTTPVYALLQVRAAIKVHDWEGFCTYVDVDSVTRGVATDMATIAEEAMAHRNLSRIITKGLSTLLNIKVRTSLREDLKGWVTGVPPAKKGMFGAILSPQGGDSRLRLKGISWRGDTATARIGIGTETILELEMKKTDAIWKVTRVVNVRALYEQARQKKE